MKCQSKTILKQKAVEGGGFAISFEEVSDDNHLTAKLIISLLPITMLAKSRLVIVAYAFVKLRAISNSVVAFQRVAKSEGFSRPRNPITPFIFRAVSFSA